MLQLNYKAYKAVIIVIIILLEVYESIPNRYYLFIVIKIIQLEE